jgi:pimeloyl-ACP methyl ester carboxylesterase
MTSATHCDRHAAPAAGALIPDASSVLARTPTPARSSRIPTRDVVVVAEDGVELHAEIAGDPTGQPTVVFCHGFGGDLDTWAPQREALAARGRVVAWDQRGHGRSQWGDPSRATVAQTGRDLAAVLEATTPTGPVVLAGHSMGGMSIQAFAGTHPELFGTRVVGVLLLSTTAGGVFSDGTLGVVFGVLRRSGLLPVALAAARYAAPVVDRLPWRSRTVGRWAVRQVLFGVDADTTQVRVAQAHAEAVPLPVDVAFYGGLLAHDQTAALPALARVPVVVLGGACDRVTPVEHSRRMSTALGPSAELVVVGDAGHMLTTTHPDLVTAALDRLLDRVRW